MSFASLLSSELGAPYVYLEPSAFWAEVSGALNLTHDDFQTARTARCVIKFTADWAACPPHVWCVEPWVHYAMDWHAGVGNNRDELCYVLDEEWLGQISKVSAEEGEAAALRYAGAFCLRNVRWLLYRHYIGHVAQMKDWPKDWPARPHNHEQALKQYIYESTKMRN